MYPRIEERGVCRPTDPPGFRRAVHHIERRGQLAPVPGREAARVERNAVGQLGVDEAEALLLALPRPEGQEYLESVDEDEVFVVSAPAHRILVGKLVVRGDAGHHLERPEAVAEGGRQVAYGLGA